MLVRDNRFCSDRIVEGISEYLFFPDNFFFFSFGVSECVVLDSSESESSGSLRRLPCFFSSAAISLALIRSSPICETLEVVASTSYLLSATPATDKQAGLGIHVRYWLSNTRQFRGSQNCHTFDNSLSLPPDCRASQG